MNGRLSRQMHRTVRFTRGLFCVAGAVFFLPVSVTAQRESPPVLMLAEEFQKSGARTLRAFRDVVASVRPSVGRVLVDGKPVALATVVDASGLLVTKRSEIKEGKLTCALADGIERNARIAAVDDENDLALLRVESGDLRPVRWAEEEPNVGQWVASAGTGGLPEAVGVVSVIARRILPKRALLGVLLDDQGGGARILDVLRGFGAERAGLRSGDVITVVNDTEIIDREHLIRTVREFRAGSTLNVQYQRDGETRETRIQLIAEDSATRTGPRRRRANEPFGDLSARADEFDLAIQHDTVLQPWQCGGPLVNLNGEVVGINIARAGRVASYALPAALVKRVSEELRGRGQ